MVVHTNPLVTLLSQIALVDPDAEKGGAFVVEASIIDCSSTRMTALTTRRTLSLVSMYISTIAGCRCSFGPYRERFAVSPSIYLVDKLPGSNFDNTRFLFSSFYIVTVTKHLFRYQVGWLA